MAIKKIIYYTRFEKSYRFLPIKIKNLAEKKEKIFYQNPFDIRLKTHELHGQLKGLWSFSVNNNYRIIFRFYKSKETVIFIDIGTHEIYK